MDLGSIITAVATVIAVVVANKLSFARSNREKIWELRRQAYGAILAQLAAITRICEHADQYIQEDLMHYFHSERYTDDCTRTAEGMTAIRNRFSDDYLIISDPFIARMEDFLADLEGDDPNATPPEEYRHFATTVSKHRPLLLRQARKEMAEPARRLWHTPWLRLTGIRPRLSRAR